MPNGRTAAWNDADIMTLEGAKHPFLGYQAV